MAPDYLTFGGAVAGTAVGLEGAFAVLDPLDRLRFGGSALGEASDDLLGARTLLGNGSRDGTLEEILEEFFGDLD